MTYSSSCHHHFHHPLLQSRQNMLNLVLLGLHRFKLSFCRFTVKTVKTDLNLYTADTGFCRRKPNPGSSSRAIAFFTSLKLDKVRYGMVWYGMVYQGLTSHSTQYRLFRRRGVVCPTSGYIVNYYRRHLSCTTSTLASASSAKSLKTNHIRSNS